MRCLLFWFFVINSVAAIAQGFEFRKWSIEHGLANPVVRNIAQDQEGYIWLGTEHGLSRFDGLAFENFYHVPSDTNSLSHNTLFGLAIDQEGVIWVGSDYGLNRYDPKTESFQRFFFDSLDQNSIPNDHIRAVFVDAANNVWIGTEDGLAVFVREKSSIVRLEDSRMYVEEKVKRNYSYNRINSFHEDAQDRIWVGTDGGGIKMYDCICQDFEPLFIPPEDSYRRRIVRAIYQSPDGIFWFGTDEGLARFDQKTNEFEFYSEDEGLSKQFVWGITQLNASRLLVSTYGGGLNLFNTITRTFERQIQPDAGNPSALSSEYIWPILRDRHGGLWLGTDGAGGLNYYHPQSRKFQHFLSAENGQLYEVHDVDVLSNGQRIVGTNQGVLLDDSDAENEQTWIIKKSNDYPHTEFVGNEILISMGNRLYRYDHDLEFQGEIKIEGFSESGFTWASATDGVRKIWIGSVSDGLCEYDLVTDEKKYFLQEGNKSIYQDSRSITAIAYGSGTRLWVASQRSGLFLLDPNSGKIEQYLHQEKGFAEPTFQAILEESEEVLWLGSVNQGLIRFNWKTRETSSFLDHETHLTNEITTLEFGNGDDEIWITSKNGLGKFDKNSGRFTTFTEEDGLQSRVFNSAATKDENGNLYFGGINGYNVFDPKPLKTSTNEVQVVLKELWVNDQIVKVGTDLLPSSLQSQTTLTLAHDQNDISIRFDAPYFLHPEKLQFQYKLSSEDTWRDLRGQRTVSMANLGPGAYDLVFRAANNDGFWGSEKYLLVVINPPYWATWWFRGIMVMSFLALVLGIYAYRLNQVKKYQKILEQQVRERTNDLRKQKEKAERDKEIIEAQNETIQQSLKERETLLREIHHRVKNNLQIVANLLYLQSGKFNDEKIRNVLEEGQGRVRSMSLIHQKLYEHEDLKSIPFGEYIIELVNEIKSSFGDEAAKVAVHINADEAYFDVESAVPLGLIINELTTNTFKYAFQGRNEGEFNIYLTKEDGQYQLHVSDNGVGLPSEIDIRRSRSLGLRLVRILSDQLEGDYSFNTTEGTNFTLTFAA